MLLGSPALAPPSELVQGVLRKHRTRMLFPNPRWRPPGKLVDGLAEIDALRQDVAGLKDIVYEIDRKIDLVIGSQHASGGNPQPE
jgi:hypothetical protein